MSLSLLGGFELRIGDKPHKTTPNFRRLLAYLAVRNRPLLRTSVAGELWPDTTDCRALANLRAVLSRLDQAQTRALDVDDTVIAIGDGVSVDLRVALAGAERLLEAEGDPLETDFRMFRGELLPSMGDHWVIPERERVRQIFMHALEMVSEQLVDHGRFAQGVLAALASIRIDPLRESSTRVLIQAHLAEGNRSEAWRAFDRYRSLVQAELGLDPSAELSRLVGAELAWNTKSS